MRAEFNQNKEDARAMHAAAETKEVGNKWWEDTEQTPEAAIESLNKWFQQSMRQEKLLQKTPVNHIEKNKTERLAKYFKENQQTEHLNKMFENGAKRQLAYEKAKLIEEQNWVKNKANTEKWEVYRDQKIELTAAFIRVLKKKNLLRRWLRLQKAGEIYAKVRENLLIRREMNRIMVNTLFVAFRFKTAYRYRYRKQYGLEMEHRTKNELRRSLAFGAMAMTPNLELQQKIYFTKFMYNIQKVFDTCRTFTSFVENLQFIQAARGQLLADREHRNQSILDRLNTQKDFLMAHYSAKSAKGKKVKALESYNS